MSCLDKLFGDNGALTVIKMSLAANETAVTKDKVDKDGGVRTMPAVMQLLPVVAVNWSGACETDLWSVVVNAGEGWIPTEASLMIRRCSVLGSLGSM